MLTLIFALRRKWGWVPIDNIWLSKGCVEWLCEKVKTEIYPSKSDLVEALILEAMKKEETVIRSARTIELSSKNDVENQK